MEKKYKRYDHYNKPLKKPTHFPKYTKTIYKAVNELLSEGTSDFILSYDPNDDFSFCCAKCSHMADVLQVDVCPYPLDSEGKQKAYAFFFYLGCPKCGDTGVRRIFLKPTSFMWQSAFSMYPDSKEICFGLDPQAVAEHPLAYKENPESTSEQKEGQP